MLLGGMDKACALIHEAAQKGQAVAVYGDYDADGVCASALVLETLEALGIRAFSYIPARLSEGYGINAEAVTALAEQAGLLISVDCGITAVEEVRLAHSLGMTVILTDHHTLPDIIPAADAIIHPQ
ncbi:MAG TPA: DHH family phosphoesterase, partial [Clostridia bacterium]|nr:DHH family phosphoesterase [Clostridia bacterium]